MPNFVPINHVLCRANKTLGKNKKNSAENSLHHFVADLLRISSRALWFHVPNGERRDSRTGAKLKRMGVRPGVADFLFVAPPHGRLLALELKAPKEGRLTESQKQFRRDLEGAGGEFAIARSPEEAIEQLKRWEII